MDFPDAVGRRRVAQAVKDRRAELDLRQEDISSDGGPSKATLFQIESGADKSYSDATIARLERTLRWASGSVAAIRDGRDPTPLKPVKPEASNGAGEGPDPQSQQMTFIGPRGLVVTITLGPDQKISDVAAEMPGVIEMVSRVFDELGGSGKGELGSAGQGGS